MTEDLIAMAAEAGFDELIADEVIKLTELERFAALIEARAVARTRDECAKCVEQQPSFDPYIEAWSEGSESAVMEPVAQGVWIMQEECAAAIRALGDQSGGAASAAARHSR